MTLPTVGQVLFCVSEHHRVFGVIVSHIEEVEPDYHAITTEIQGGENAASSDITHHKFHFARLTYYEGQSEKSSVFTDRAEAFSYAMNKAQKEVDNLTKKLSHLNIRVAYLKMEAAQ